MSYVTPYVPQPGNVDVNYNMPPNYKIVITSLNNAGLPLESNMPASWQVGVHASWDQPFSKPMADMVGDSSVSGGLGKFGASAARFSSAATGVSTTTQFLTTSVWQNGSTMSLEIPMTFRAFNDPVKDVTDKIVQLMSMCAPGVNPTTQTLQAPGPTLAKSALTTTGAYSGAGAALSSGISAALGAVGLSSYKGDIISVAIGSFMYFPSVIITGVSAEIHNMFDINGNPLAATVNVSIETPVVVTKDDFKTYFPKTNYVPPVIK